MVQYRTLSKIYKKRSDHVKIRKRKTKDHLKEFVGNYALGGIKSVCFSLLVLCPFLIPLSIFIWQVTYNGLLSVAAELTSGDCKLLPATAPDVPNLARF